MGFGGSSGGSASISSSSDVALSSPANNEVLSYNSSTSKWRNATVAAGGTSEVMVIKYSGGQYPALPISKPTGVNLILFKGPAQPTSGNVSGGMPSYLGDGSNQIMSDYEWRNLA